MDHSVEITNKNASTFIRFPQKLREIIVFITKSFCYLFSRNILQVRVIFSLFHTVRTSRVVTQGSHHGEDEEKRADYCSSNAKQLNHWQMAVLPGNFRIFLLIIFSKKMNFWKLEIVIKNCSKNLKILFSFFFQFGHCPPKLATLTTNALLRKHNNLSSQFEEK